MIEPYPLSPIFDTAAAAAHTAHRDTQLLWGELTRQITRPELPRTPADVLSWSYRAHARWLATQLTLTHIAVHASSKQLSHALALARTYAPDEAASAFAAAEQGFSALAHTADNALANIGRASRLPKAVRAC